MQADEQGPYNYGMKKIRIVVMWWFQRGVGGESVGMLLESAVAFPAQILVMVELA